MGSTGVNEKDGASWVVTYERQQAIPRMVTKRSPKALMMAQQPGEQPVQIRQFIGSCHL